MVDLNVTDVLGVEPIGEAALAVTKASIEGAGAFLSRICLPAAEEFGFLIRDKVAGWREHSEWRAKQALAVLTLAEEIVKKREGFEKFKAHPRLVKMILENGTWSSEDEIHNAWSGLLAASCSENPSDENLRFIDILSSLTLIQIRFINYIFQNSKFKKSKNGFIFCEYSIFECEYLLDAMGLDHSDIHVLDYQIDGLRELGLFGSPTGFAGKNNLVAVVPAPFAVSFYVRCQGFVDHPSKYFLNCKDRDQDVDMNLIVKLQELLELDDPTAHEMYNPLVIRNV